MTDQEQFSAPAEIRHVIGAAGSFSLHNVSGSVKIRGADTDEARVIASSGHEGDSLPLLVRRSEGGLHIQVVHKGFEIFGLRGAWGSPDIDFDVAVPHGARVEINGVSSDINAKALDGQQTYKTVSGDIDIDGHGGRVSVTTVSGGVQLAADRPLEASLTTTSGNVELGAPLLTGLQMKTVSGDARIHAGFAAGPLHTFESVSGDLSLRPLNGLAVEVRTGLGMSSADGRRLLAGDGSAQFRFRSLSGDLQFAAHDAGQPAPLTAASPARSAPSAGSLEVLRALERGEIDVEEASRRLEGALSNG
jgi:hypothetical protein